MRNINTPHYVWDTFRAGVLLNDVIVVEQRGALK